jgi:GTP-binding protein
MIDATNYREMNYQFSALQEEIKRYSEILSKRAYAIAITKIDALSDEEINLKVKDFLNSINLEANSVATKYKADEKILSYAQEKQEWQEYDFSKPLFVLPISAVAKRNLKALKFMLYNLIKSAKEKGE